MTSKTRTAATVAIAVFGSAVPAFAELKFDTKFGGHVSFYGQFDPALISVDDGQQTNTRLLDNALSNSRLGLRYYRPLGEREFMFRFETGLRLPSSAEWDQNGSFFSGWTIDDIRHFDFSLKGRWGKTSLGQGSMVSDGAATIDLSYVGLALYSFTNDENTSFIYRDPAGALSGPTIRDTADNFDGSRGWRARYDTPKFNGFTAGVSGGVAWGQNILDLSEDDDTLDLGVFYANTFEGGVQFAAGVAYARRARDDNTGTRKDTMGSASVLLRNGLSFTVAAGRREDDKVGASNPEYWYGKVAYEGQWLTWGKTGVGVDYYSGRDFVNQGSDTHAWGIALVQKIERINTDAYLKYRSHVFDDGTTRYQRNQTWVLGALWKF
ncbi:porin [Ruegeria sediminis]|uniref:Porin n=1 Tax=Ruegeria sediminis TaxID=2583820 RepID=A0ABY2WVE8_9RHOB|nr:porin [Ruegeria sediminis]